MNAITQPMTSDEFSLRQRWIEGMVEKMAVNMGTNDPPEYENYKFALLRDNDGQNPGEIDYLALNREFGLE